MKFMNSCIRGGIITDEATVVMQPELSESDRKTERDPRELYVNGKERSQLRKNSNLSDLKNFDYYVEDIYEINGHTVCICDTDMFLFQISELKAYIGKHITNKFYDVIIKKEPIHINNQTEYDFIPIVNDDNILEVVEQYIYPIEVKGEVVGAVVIITKENEKYVQKSIQEAEIKLAKRAAEFISKEVELI